MKSLRKIKKYLFLAFLLGLITIGCRKDIKSIEMEKTQSRAEVRQDSLETLFKMQSNADLMLSDRIILKNSVYVLDMSEKEASELHISPELYHKYVEAVKGMNYSNDNNSTNKVK